MNYTEQELSKLIEDVEKEFTAHLAKAEEESSTPLAKSEETPVEAPAEQPQAVEAVAKTEETLDLAKAEEHKEEPKEAQHEEHKEHDEEHEEHHDHCDYDDEDMEEMHKMYKSMSKGELKAHHSAVMKAMEHHGLEKCGEISMGKSEELAITPVVEETKPNPEIELLKSEIEAQKAKNEELKKNWDGVAEFLTKLVKKSAPQAKAITSLDTIAKSESAIEEKQLTKGEITVILSKKAADSSLKKSDRDAINAYYNNGQLDINGISHLLK